MKYTLEYLKSLREDKARELFKEGEVFSFYMDDEHFKGEFFLVIEDMNQENR